MANWFAGENENVQSSELDMDKWKYSFKTRLLFEPRDLWVGLYWDYQRIGRIWHCDFYICILPMLPVKITVIRLLGPMYVDTND